MPASATYPISSAPYVATSAARLTSCGRMRSALPNSAPAVEALGTECPPSKEGDVLHVDRSAVHEGDDLVRGPGVVVHLPMGGVDVGEGRARTVADELQ